MDDNHRCSHITQIRVAGRGEYRYVCDECKRIMTAVEARDLGNLGPIHTTYAPKW